MVIQETHPGGKLFLLQAMIAWIMIGCSGCKSTESFDAPVIEVQNDSLLERLSSDGRETFAEGHVDVAIDSYRDAIRRAWALDDPAQTGALAYNLAACLFSAGEIEEARDWLIESRAELHRARHSVGNVWLLEAKIARQECRLEDVQEFIQLAECVCAPCEVYCSDDDGCCSCCSNDPCDPPCGSKIPCVGKKILEKEVCEDCQESYRTQIQLARARAANDFGDICQAETHLACARGIVNEFCLKSLRSEVENVAAEVHLAREEYWQAAKHFDLEADYLREAGNLRVIPEALDAAAQAYLRVGRVDLAADRWGRAARIYHGRGDQKAAWNCVTSAAKVATGLLVTEPSSDQSIVELAVTNPVWTEGVIESDLIEFTPAADCQPNVIEKRLAIIAREINRVLEASEDGDEEEKEPNESSS